MGSKKAAAYNGHFASVCYHPLFLFNDHGDCVAAKLRPGNVSSADDWDELLVPEIERQQTQGKRVAWTRRRRLRAAGDLRGAGGVATWASRHPHPGQQESGAGDRGRAIPVTGTAQPHAARPLQERPVSGGQLDDVPRRVVGRKSNTTSVSCSRASASS